MLEGCGHLTNVMIRIYINIIKYIHIYCINYFHIVVYLCDPVRDRCKP